VCSIRDTAHRPQGCCPCVRVQRVSAADGVQYPRYCTPASRHLSVRTCTSCVGLLFINCFANFVDIGAAIQVESNVACLI
jgi:hypothetical protein